MKLYCKTNDPRDLAEAVYGSLNRHVFGTRGRHRRIADVVTPLVMGSIRRRHYWDEPGELSAGELVVYNATRDRQVARDVKAGLGILQYIFWSWILPKVIEWIVDWYFSANGSAMRATHRADSRVTCEACGGQGGHHAGADRHYEPVLCERCGGTGVADND